MAPNHNFVDPERIEHGSPLRLPGHPVNGQPMDLEGWSGIQTEVHILASLLLSFFCI
jgi:protein quaking